MFSRVPRPYSHAQRLLPRYVVGAGETRIRTMSCNCGDALERVDGWPGDDFDRRCACCDSKIDKVSNKDSDGRPFAYYCPKEGCTNVLCDNCAGQKMSNRCHVCDKAVCSDCA
jgi:hypothetical protein